MKNIIFFGGSGFIGVYFVKELINQGHRVLVYDLKKPNFSHKNLKFVKGNIIDIKKINKIIKKNSHVFNFAGWSDIGSGEKNPKKVLNYNVKGNSVILKVSKKKSVKRFVFASSIYVFSRYGGVYKDSKQQCEINIKKSNIKSTIIRFGSIYGSGSTDGNTIYDLLKMAIQKRKITYWGKGDEVRQYIHVRDTAKICRKIFLKEYENKSVLVTGLEDIRSKDLINMINEMFNKKIKIEYKYSKRSVSHYKNTPFSILKNPKYVPEIGEKIILETYTDIGQGVYELANLLIRKLKKNKD